jgi:flagellar motor switch protein FliM
MPDLQVPLRKLTELTPGDVIRFSKNVSSPALMMVEDVHLCLAAPVRINARRAARVLSLETALPAAGEP